MKELKTIGEPKKGKKSWRPASVTDVVSKEPGYRYRWSNKDADNLSKKESEGWETVSKITSDGAKLSEERFQDGKQLASTYEKHDVILQRIPEELAQERDKYFNHESARRVEGLTAHLRNELKSKNGAAVHGEITISSKTGTQVIE